MRAAARPMRVLCVLTSSNQLYSGIGRALFECARRIEDRIDYTFSIDDRHERNVSVLKEFGRQHDFGVEVGRAVDLPGALDPVSDRLPDLMRDSSWDAVECVCWADAGTHSVVLDHLGPRPLIYTPHHQPAWTVAMLPEVARRVDETHRAMLRRADLVLCDSPWERRELARWEPRGGRFAFVPLGCDFETEPLARSRRRPQLLFVGDLAEPRKRFDRVLAVFGQLARRDASLRLVVIGNRSDASGDRIPPAIRARVELRGYVPEDELRQAYAESLGLFLLSDYEAFGIPILEALAAGTAVFVTRQPTTESLFGAFRGVHFCPGDDLAATCAIVAAVLDRIDAALDDAAEDRLRLQAAFDWSILAKRKAELMAAAWSGRCLFAVPASGGPEPTGRAG
jgi:glycosyltransferase involved in cell wall biosynthesis